MSVFIWRYRAILEEGGLFYECRLSDELDVRPPWIPVGAGNALYGRWGG